MTQDRVEPAVAREQLFAKLLSVRSMRKKYGADVIASRVAKMTYRQVEAALAMTNEEIASACSEADGSARWAPATGDGPARLWDHVDVG